MEPLIALLRIDDRAAPSHRGGDRSIRDADVRWGLRVEAGLQDRTFVVYRVGRSDDDVAGRLKQWAATRLEPVKCSYATPPKVALERECVDYRDSCGPEGQRDNNQHPDRPADAGWKWSVVAQGAAIGRRRAGGPWWTPLSLRQTLRQGARVARDQRYGPNGTWAARSPGLHVGLVVG